MEDAAIRDFSKGPTIFALLLSLFFWWIARKKTVWNYNITSKGGDVEFWEDYFKCTKYVFKGLSILAIVCVITAVSIAPGMMWAIAGVGGMVIIASIKLMRWKNEIRVKRFTWDRPQCIFTDRKRGMVVLERRYDPDIAFAENYMYIQIFLRKKGLMSSLPFAENMPRATSSMKKVIFVSDSFFIWSHSVGFIFSQNRRRR